MMLRDEFESAYAKRSNMTVERLRQYRVTLPCGCGDETCESWASVSVTDAGLLLHHLAFSLPDVETLREMEIKELEHGN